MGGPGWGGAESPGKVALGDRVKERHEEWRQVPQLLAQGMTYDPQMCSWPLCWPRAWKPSTWKSSDSRHQRKIPGQRHPLSSSHPNAIGEVGVACAAVWGVFGIPAPVPMGQMQHLEEPDWVSLILSSENTFSSGLRLPPELFEQLQMLLEPNSITGNDWRRLASHLGLCGMKIR